MRGAPRRSRPQPATRRVQAGWAVDAQRGIAPGAARRPVAIARSVDREPDPLPTPSGAFRVARHRGAPGLTRRQADRVQVRRPVTRRALRGRRPGPSAGPAPSAPSSAHAPDAVLTGVSAALHWGLPVPPWTRPRRHGAGAQSPCRRGPRTPPRRGVSGQRLLLPPGHVTDLRWAAGDDPGRTWLDCAAQIPIEYLDRHGRRDPAHDDSPRRRDLAAVRGLGLSTPGRAHRPTCPAVARRERRSHPANRWPGRTWS